MSDKENNEKVIENDGNVYTLRQPLSFEGETYESLKLDFHKLTGEDIISCERQYQSSNHEFSFVKETSKAYQAYVVARAARVPAELIFKLSASDFSRVTLRCQNFLLGSA